MINSSTTAATVKSIYIAALEVPDSAERNRYLDQVCNGDGALRAEVEQLLSVRESEHTNLLSRAVQQMNPRATASHAKGGASATALGDPIEPSSHPVVDRYKVLEAIGRGGMGTVYMAQQLEPVKRRVALKVINPGMDSREVIARFEAERQALAMMGHPHIARVFDGGTTDQGRPYFVMELVRGVPITEYCQTEAFLLEDRLRLFIDVCQAVQHAHQKGIIHRDLKPSNVQITNHDGKPVVKVIDFGVAKALHQELTERTLYTHFGQLVGTPLYMSPEQADLHGLDVDTRSDIYSLGVLLYEILTGTTPFDRKQVSEAGVEGARRLICEVDPPRPSVRLSTLEAINDSTLNVRRQGPSKRRSLSFALRGDLDWIVMKALEKDRNDRYESASALAQDIERHLNSEPIEARPPTPFTRFAKWSRRHVGVVWTAMCSLTLLTVVALVGALLLSQSRNRAIQQRERAEISERRATVAAERSAQITQFLKDMLESVDPGSAGGRDTTLLRQIVDETANRVRVELVDYPEVEAELSEILGHVYRNLSEDEQAARLLKRALELKRRLCSDNSLAVGETLYLLGQVYWQQGRSDAAEQAFRRALSVRIKFLGVNHADVASVMCALGSVLRRAKAKKERQEAENLLRESLAIRRRLLGENHPDVAESLGALGILLRGDKRWHESEACFREAIEIKQNAYPHDDARVRGALDELGVTLTFLPGRRKEGIALLQDGLAFERKLYGVHKKTANTLYRLAGLVENPRDAEEYYREAIAMREKLAPSDEAFIFKAKERLARLLVERGDDAAVDELLTSMTPLTAEGYFRRARTYQVADDNGKAAADFERAVEIDPLHFQAWRDWVDLLTCEFSDYEKSLAVCDRALEVLPNQPHLLMQRATAYRKLGQHEEVLVDLEDSLQLDSD